MTHMTLNNQNNEKMKQRFPPIIKWGEGWRTVGRGIKIKDFKDVWCCCYHLYLLTSDDYVYTQREETETQR